MILVGGYVVALSPPISKLLRYIALIAKTPTRSVIIVSCVALLSSWINWGLGLVIGGLLCREIAKTVPKVNFRLLVASAYSGFIVWHGGLSGSIPLTIATAGNFTEPMMGTTIPVGDTLFSTFNIIAVIGLVLIIPITNGLISLTKTKDVEFSPHHFEASEKTTISPAEGPAEKLENSFLISLLTSILGFSYIAHQILDRSFKFDLDTINFIFLFLAILLHGKPKLFIGAIIEASKRVGPILLQFPFYAGIMGMMKSSGLAVDISNAFMSFSNTDNFLLITFYSAAFVNLFIPSGGGQWAIQAPVVIPVAKALGIDLAKTAMAVSWGDAWTNLLQPFWALPLLGIAGLKLKDIMGYCLVILFVSGVFLSVIFWV
jgi:short-chain fatty acids transporter